MIDVRNIRLKDTIPENIKRDAKIIALAESLDKSLEASFRMIDGINYDMNLQKLSESTIDHLLWENHVEENEGLAFANNKDEKIRLLESAKELHRTKGTPYAIEKILEVMNLKSYVKEWFEYEGDPYFFRVHTKAIIQNETKYRNMLQAITTFKNTRSWLEKIVIEREKEMDLKISVIKRDLKRLTFKPHELEDVSLSEKLYLGASIRQSKSIILNPAILKDDMSLENIMYPTTIRRQLRYLRVVPDMLDTDVSLKITLTPATIKVSVKSVEIKPVGPNNLCLNEKINIIGVTKMMNKITIKEGV